MTSLNENESMKQFPSEDLSSSVDILKPSPSFLIVIVSIVASFIDKNPDADVNEVLYHTVRSFLKSTMKFVDSGQDISVVFVYYIEAYRAFKIYQLEESEKSSETLDPQHTHLLNEATLSIFDLYVDNSTNVLIRRLLPLATNALHEVITVHQSHHENIQEILGSLATITLLSQTIDFYVRGHQRDRNFEYVLWLKEFFKRCLSTTDLSFINEDKIIKNVVKAVTNRQKYIPSTTIRSP